MQEVLMIDSVTLILEGGGMRGAFTAGVLDEWLEQRLHFKTVYGVSAGACQACSYLCSQKGRGIRVWKDYLRDRRFCSLSSLLRTGDLFNAQFNYEEIPQRLDPIDGEVYARSGAKLYAVVTNLHTGQAEYLPVEDMRRDMPLIRATASLPLISRPVEIGGQLYLDGGVADPIPLAYSIAQGCARHVLVLTRTADYRKEPMKGMPLLSRRYKEYPAFVEMLSNRHMIYNDTLELIAREQAEGRAFVLRPGFPPDIGRIERNPDKLETLYQHGRAVAQRNAQALTAFLQEE